MRTQRCRRRLTPALAGPALAGVLAVAACSGGPAPELVASQPTTTPTPSPTPAPVPTPTAVPATPTPVTTPTPSPTPVPALDRGVTDEVVRIGVLKSGSVFGDVEVGVAARLARAAASGRVAGREIELVRVLDDGGDPDELAAAARQRVEEDEVFAVVLASAVPDPRVTDYLAARSVPFFGWGFAPGFCAPNEWGFGFNGCLVGATRTTTRDLLQEHFGADATAVLVVSDDAAGAAAAAEAEQVWGGRLLEVVGQPDAEAARAAIAAHGPDVVLLSVGLDDAVSLKAALIGSFEGAVVDDVSYLPGLLGDFVTADRLEDGYAVTQFPPQEEYREVTAQVSTDLEAVGGALIYSQAVSIGYWATDLLVALLEATGSDLDTATFHGTVNVTGVEYAPGADGAPCPMNTRDIHTSPAGGGALLRVDGGIYRPVVQFRCFGRG